MEIMMEVTDFRLGLKTKQERRLYSSPLLGYNASGLAL